MPGISLRGAQTAAGKLRLSLEEYQARIGAGQKWCTGCKAWHSADAFPRDRSRPDGLHAWCQASRRGRPFGPRDPERKRARNAVTHAVRSGRMSKASLLPCTDCGHSGTDRRHEYDHYLGYAPEHQLSVEAVCTTCHADRERVRRTAPELQDDGRRDR
jgi:hypothetical protein